MSRPIFVAVDPSPRASSAGAGDMRLDERIVRRQARQSTLYTIGHSTRPVEELIDILHAFAVTRLVDIRSIPRSRTNPQFNLDVLPDALSGAGITHVHLAALENGLA